MFNNKIIFNDLSIVNKVCIVSIITDLILLIIFSGGFNSTITFILGAATSIITIVVAFKCNKNILSAAVIILFLLSCISFLSIVIMGVSSSSILYSLSFFSIIGILVLYSSLDHNAKIYSIKVFTISGILFSFIGVIVFFIFFGNPSFVYSGRLMFPFQYANTSGLWFCVVAILCGVTKNWKFRIAAILPIVACLLTKSAGAIGIMFVVSIIFLVAGFKTEEHEHKFNVMAIVIYVAIIVSVVVFGILNVDRIYESSQTFIERFIQMGDGISVWLTSPILGIGPDQWQFVYPYAQSAQYTAAKIHNSYLQILLDGGIFALLIFLAFVIYSIVKLVKARKGTYLICSCAILVHAFFDFDLSFPLMLILLLMFLDTEIKWGSKAPNIVLASIAFVGCCFGIFFNTQLNNTINLPKNIEKSKAIDLTTYPDYILNDVKASTYLSIALTNSERHEEAFMLASNTKFASSTQQYFAFHSLVQLGKMADANYYLSEILTKQPFNVDLFDKIHDYLTNECHEQQFVETYNKCAMNSNDALKFAPASYLNGQKSFKLI